MSFTKGKWAINDFSKHPIQLGEMKEKVGGCYIEDEDAGTLAIIPDFTKKHSDYKANARLIAAAPGLLEVCKKLVACWNEDEIYPDDKSFEALAEATVAIAAAE